MKSFFCCCSSSLLQASAISFPHLFCNRLFRTEWLVDDFRCVFCTGRCKDLVLRINFCDKNNRPMGMVSSFIHMMLLKSSVILSNKYVQSVVYILKEIKLAASWKKKITCANAFAMQFCIRLASQLINTLSAMLKI